MQSQVQVHKNQSPMVQYAIALRLALFIKEVVLPYHRCMGDL